MAKNVYLVRHAESEANKAGMDFGNTPPLSELGCIQAQAIAQRVAKISGLKRIICSTLPRALETAETIATWTRLPIEKNALFDQRRRPSCLIGESHLDSKAISVMREIFEGYTIPGHRHSDEENLDDLRRRAAQALSFLETHPDDILCVITHGMFLRTLFVHILTGGVFSGVDLQHAVEHLEPGNTGITQLRFESVANPISGKKNELWKIVSWNDSTHLS